MKEPLPYFKFKPAEYLTKDVSFCSLEAQGFFINVCCYYWQRRCDLTVEQLLKRIPKKELLNELIFEKVLKISEEKIKIRFLDEQFLEVTRISSINSANGKKGGRPRKKKKSEKKPTAFDSLSETKGTRQDKTRQDKNNSNTQKSVDFGQLVKFFNKKTGKKTRIVNDKAKRQIKARLKNGYTKEDIAKVISNASQDKHHIDSGYKYLTLELISRPEKFDMFLTMEVEPKELTTEEKNNKFNSSL